MSANTDRLIEEYQAALRMWAQTRQYFPYEGSPEVMEAAWRVERLEREIAAARHAEG